MTPRFALSQALEHVEGEEQERLGLPSFATHVLALAKPPNMSRGRVYGMRRRR
jgi:hypothetical protein